MTRRDREAGIIKSCILGAALIAGLAMPAFADDTKLTLSGSATFTTDYMFRSISNTKNLPAAQPEIDLTYGMFWAYIWGSNTSFGHNIELDYGAGISPKWKDVTFTLGALEYTYPGASNIDYFEFKAGAAWASGPWSLAVNNYWSPNNFNFFGTSDAIEGTVGYAFAGKLFNFFSPSVSGTFGHQTYEKNAADYNYWNAGLTLGFMDHWSADIRYYDTDYDHAECFANTGNSFTACDARVVGAIKVTF